MSFVYPSLNVDRELQWRSRITQLHCLKVQISNPNILKIVTNRKKCLESCLGSQKKLIDKLRIKLNCTFS